MANPRFNDFREMTSRRGSAGCVNGTEHAIQAGDRIGWSRRHKLACCAPCWARWTSENQAADEYEATLPDNSGW